MFFTISDLVEHNVKSSRGVGTHIYQHTQLMSVLKLIRLFTEYTSGMCIHACCGTFQLIHSQYVWHTEKLSHTWKEKCNERILSLLMWDKL